MCLVRYVLHSCINVQVRSFGREGVSKYEGGGGWAAPEGVGALMWVKCEPPWQMAATPSLWIVCCGSNLKRKSFVCENAQHVPEGKRNYELD